ncbi:MAG: mechanosensitive ion channel family protein [Bacteroidales bacterium]|nr:mechanosensitive ion channel family protein [Bacteroidales bacterium]
MATRLKYLLALLPALLLFVPSRAERINENDLGHTLEALHTDLREDYVKRVSSNKRFDDQYRAQRREMVATLKRCNELALLLYSQKQDYTFDLTYALQSVTSEYESYTSKRLPYDRIVDRLDWDIDRYARLLESLRRIPPEIQFLNVIPDSLGYHNRKIDSLERAQRSVFYAGRSQKELERLRKAMIERMRADTTGTSGPFILSEEEADHRDSCIFYAAELLKLSAQNKTRVISDSTHYQRAFLRLKESYDYSRERYVKLQERIFVQGQTAYPGIIKRFGSQWTRAWNEIKNKYNMSMLLGIDREEITFNSPSRGPLMLAYLFFELLGLFVSILVVTVFFKLAVRFIKPLGNSIAREQHSSYIWLIAIILFGIISLAPSYSVKYIESASNLVGTYLWLLAAVIAALLIRLKPKHLREGLSLYSPLMVAAIIVIGLRIIFMPNSMMNVLFPPLLLVFTVWQLIMCFRYGGLVPGIDRIFGWLTFVVFAASLVVAFLGYIFFALIIMVWWFFQMAIIHTIATVSHLLEQFRQKYMPRRIEEYKKRLTFVNAAERDNLLFGATWLYDLIKDVLMPVMTIVSVPLCIKFSLGVFEFTDLYQTIYLHPFVNLANADGVTSLRLSFKIIVLATSLFFVFRYINYALYSIFQVVRYSAFMKASGRKVVRKNEINFSLGKSLISTIVWFVYIITVVVLLKLPTSSLTIIAGGLSAGIGIALKDVLNNFIYGLQLMSGRLRVGDWIECDGVRGRVTKISYQSTEIETIEGAVQSFLNATLFGKNFSNLTRNNSYEFVKIIVGVSYGTEVEKVRQVLVDAMQVLRTKDHYGREVVDPDKGIYVVFEGFGDSSVDLAVKQYVLVAERIGYVDRAREVIYSALNDAGITIPFPQRDIHVISGSE